MLYTDENSTALSGIILTILAFKGIGKDRFGNLLREKRSVLHHVLMLIVV